MLHTTATQAVNIIYTAHNCNLTVNTLQLVISRDFYIYLSYVASLFIMQVLHTIKY